ncbi:MAG: hypothetical protein JSW54_07055 [Fidelibacterota bacterium]|nr:MAG: hypothetical protein JSW54_07055 [Candidatus Neomarinimicrobiota bacterium]
MTIRVCRITSMLMLLVAPLVASSYADGTIYHQMVTEAVAQEPLTLEAVVEVEEVAVVSAGIYYRLMGQTSYLEAPMSSAGGNLYFGTIPAADVTVAGLQYYLIAVLEDESVLAYPVDDPEINPISVVVQPPVTAVEEAGVSQAAGAGEANVLILSPEPREFYLPEDVVIGVSLFNLPDLDGNSIRLLIDGQDVTAQAEITDYLISYAPPDLVDGAHQVEVRMNRTSGIAYEPVAWRFLVTQKAAVTTERAYEHSGAVRPSYQRDNIDGEVLEVSSMRVSYRGGWEWLKFRSSLKLTSQEDRYKPPRNRYSANFQTPILNLGIGDVTPRINRFGMDGKRLRGYDVNLTLKYFNLRVAQGELERVIQGRPESAYMMTGYDPIADAPDTLHLSRDGYTFRRDVLAVRPSFGSGQRFELAFSLIKAKDKVPSVDQILEDAIVRIDTSDAPESTFANVDWIDDTLHTIAYKDLARYTDFKVKVPEGSWAGKSPQDNIVIGSNLSMAFNKRRFVLQGGFALSMLNKDIWEPIITRDKLDTLSIIGDSTLDGRLGDFDMGNLDPTKYADYFHINPFKQVPIVPIDPFGTIDMTTISKMPSLAYHGSVKLNYLRNAITLEYQQVGPEFNSLANPNLQRNIRVRTISDRIRMFGSRLFITALYRGTDDNIVKLEDDPITSTATVNLNASLNLGTGLPSVSLGQRTYQRSKEHPEYGIDGLEWVERDTLVGQAAGGEDSIVVRDPRENSLTKAINFSMSYRLDLLESIHDLSLTMVNTAISDEIDNRPADAVYASPTAKSNILSLSASSRFSERLETNVVLATNKSEIGAGEDVITQNIFNLDASARYLMMDGKLRVMGRISLTNNKTNEDDNPIAPPSFSRFGIKGGASVLLVENLRLVTALEIRNKQLEIDGVKESLQSSIVSANLEYTF